MDISHTLWVSRKRRAETLTGHSGLHIINRNEELSRGGGQAEDTSAGNGDFVHLLHFIYRFNVNSDSFVKVVSPITVSRVKNKLSVSISK